MRLEPSTFEALYSVFQEVVKNVPKANAAFPSTPTGST